MAAVKVAGVGGSHRPRTRIPHGNMCAKLSDYIGQVFECKAEGAHYLRRVLENWRGSARQARRAQLAGRITARREIVRKRVLREAYFVIRARLARNADRIGRFFFASRAYRARLACLTDDSRARAMRAKPLHSLTSSSATHSIEPCHASKCAKP